jgi:hypothetical protein
LLYWLTFAGYLLATAVVPRAIAGASRWPRSAVVVGAGVVGAILLLPANCRSLPMLMCDTRSVTPDCELSGDNCSTLVGLDVPYADATGIPGAQTIGSLLILAGIAFAVVTQLASRASSRRRKYGRP